MNLDDIKTEFGLYYIKGSDQNMKRLFTLLKEKNETKECFSSMVTDDTRWRAAKATMGRVVQAFQKEFTPTTGPTFKPLWIDLFKLKVDLKEYPDDLEGNWLAFMADNKHNRKDWPFIRWFIEVLVIPQIQEDMELLEIYNGVYAEPTSGTPSAPGTSMDGIGKTLADLITAGKVTPIVTGVFSTDPETFVTQVEDFVKQIPKIIRKKGLTINFSDEYVELYEQGYDLKYNKDNKTGIDNHMVKYVGGKVKIKGLVSMRGSQRFWTTPKENAKHLSKREKNKKSFFLEIIDRQVKIWTDWWEGLGFVLAEYVFCNEQV